TDVPRTHRRGGGGNVRQVADVHLLAPDGEPLQRVPPAQAGGRARSVEDDRLRAHRGGAMNSTLGTLLVLGGLLAAAFGAVVGIEGGLRHRPGAIRLVLASVTAFLVCMLGANLVMVRALVTHDFSVHYVAQVGSRATPLVYTVVSLW